MRTRAMTPDLTGALGELLGLGSALVRNFRDVPFPACTRLARDIRSAAVSASRADLADRIVQADAMIVQVTLLQSSIAGLSGLGPMYEHRLFNVAATLSVYGETLIPRAKPRTRAKRAA